MICGDLSHMAELSEYMGVDAYCVAPWLGIWTDCEEGNRIVADMAKRDKHVYPYALINPTYGTDVEKEAYHYHVEEKFPAMKMFYSRTGVRYNDPVFEPWYKIANENKLFALMDSGGYPQYLSDMAELAEKYPDITFFLDHAGRNFACAESYAALAKKYDNVYLQLTFTSVPEGLIEYLCAEDLAHKTLYGTDAPMRDPRPQLGWVAFANILTRTAKGNALIDKAVITYLGGFTYNNANAVVDNKSSAYCGARMDFNTRFSNRALRNGTGNKLHIVFIKPMRPAIHTYSLYTGI